MEPLVGKGFSLWMDNFYNSSDLALHLTDCVGTMRITRENVPKEVKDEKLKKGEIIARHSGPVTVFKWYGKTNVTIISTYHNAETKTVTKRGEK